MQGHAWPFAVRIHNKLNENIDSWINKGFEKINEES